MDYNDLIVAWLPHDNLKKILNSAIVSWGQERHKSLKYPDPPPSNVELPCARLLCWWSATQHKNGCHFADKIFKFIFFKENILIWIQISLWLVPVGVQLFKKSALVQVMAWRLTGDKPLPEPMVTQFIFTDTDTLAARS